MSFWLAWDSSPGQPKGFSEKHLANFRAAIVSRRQIGKQEIKIYLKKIVAIPPGAWHAVGCIMIVP
jgi:hypothetical protein